MRKNDFSIDAPLYDRKRQRRYLCENCGQVLLWTKFSMPEGRKGICLKCKDKMRKEESAKKKANVHALAKEILAGKMIN